MVNKQLSYAPADVRPTFCGWAKPLMNELQDTFKNQIILLCYEEPKSISELSEALQTGYEYIQDAVKSLCKNKLLGKSGEKYLTTIPMFHLRTNFEVTAVKNRMILEHNIPQKINDILTGLKDKISALDFYGHNFDIKYLNWITYVIATNMIKKQLRSYFSSKTNEVVIDEYAWQTQHYDASAEACYKYADEHPEEEAPECEKRLEQYSTYYNHAAGDIEVNNAYDCKPFPDGIKKENGSVFKDYESGRNGYISNENISVYLNLVQKNHQPTEAEKPVLEKFLENGVVTEAVLGVVTETVTKDTTEKASGGNQLVPMLPVFTKECFAALEKMIFKEMLPVSKEIAESIGTKLEEMLLPHLKNVKVTKEDAAAYEPLIQSRVDQFYSFWLYIFLAPWEELFWYGLNGGGFAIPEDYNKSVAGMWITI